MQKLADDLRRRQARYEESLPYYHAALVLWLQLQDPQGLAGTLVGLGGAYERLAGQAAQAALLEVASRVDDVNGFSDVRRATKDALSTERAWRLTELALVSHGWRLEEAKARGDVLGQADEISNLAETEARLGNLDTAARYQRWALRVHLEAGDLAAADVDLRELADYSERLGDDDELERLKQRRAELQAAAAGSRMADPDVGVDPALRHLVDALGTLLVGGDDAALTTLVSSGSSRPSERRTHHSLRDLARTSRVPPRPHRGRRPLSRGGRRARRGSPRPGAGRLRARNGGPRPRLAGRSGGSVCGEPEARTRGRQRRRRRALRPRVTYLALSRNAPEDAERALTTARAAAEEDGRPDLIAFVEMADGVAHARGGEHEQAAVVYQRLQALAADPERTMEPRVRTGAAAAALAGQIALHLRQGDARAAADLLPQLLERQDGTAGVERIEDTLLAGQVQLVSGDLDPAKRSFNRALRLADDQAQAAQRASALEALSTVYALEGLNEPSLRMGGAALDELERLRASAGASAARIAFGADSTALYEQVVETCLLLARLRRDALYARPGAAVRGAREVPRSGRPARPEGAAAAAERAARDRRCRTGARRPARPARGRSCTGSGGLRRRRDPPGGTLARNR